MDKKNYFAEQYNRANELILGLDDFGAYNAPMPASGERWFADSVGETAPAEQTSEPIIISLGNTTGGALTDITFLNAISSIGATNNGVTLGVTASYGNGTYTYAQFLQDLMGQEYLIREIYLQCSTTTQLTAPFTIYQQRVTGDTRSTPIFPTIDPNQNQTVNLRKVVNFVLNKNTKIILSSLAAAVTAAAPLTIYFWPAVITDRSQTLIGGAPIRTQGNPWISQPQPVIAVK